jgi:hypothetical protein
VRLCDHCRDGSGPSRSRNATKHPRMIAATIRLVPTSVWGPRSSDLAINLIIFWLFI